MEPRILTALPVFNEHTHIAEVLDAVRRFSRDILVVDDGSTDVTPEVLAQQPHITVRTHDTNRGYGAALNTAFEHACENEFDVLVTIDCDGQHQPRLIPELAQRVFADDGPFDMVSGSRYLKLFDGDSQPPEDRRRINRDITSIVNQRFDLKLTDTFCGFKAYRVDSLRDLNITEFGYAMPLQLWVQAAALDWKIVEFPVPLIYLDEDRSFGGSLDDANRRMAYYTDVLEREIAAQPALVGPQS